MSTDDLVICEFCDSVYRRAPLRGRGAACCRRCGAKLYRDARLDLDRTLALVLTALLTFVIANCYPLLSVGVGGKSADGTLWRIILDTSDSNVAPIALVAATSVFFFPLLQICLYGYVAIALRRGRVPAAFIGVMHALRQMRPWTMVEVFMLGMLVAVVKLGDEATSSPEIGMWAFAVLTLLLTLLNSIALEEFWERAEEIERAAGGDPLRVRTLPAEAGSASAWSYPAPVHAAASQQGGPDAAAGHHDVPSPRAAALGLMGCRGCGLVLRARNDATPCYCPRCDSALHRRKPDSQRRAWAFLISAALLYIPANTLTVMRTTELFDVQDNTILSGVVQLWNNGAWDLALIVFTASIVVPLVKIACLLLLLAGGRGSPLGRRERTRVYRMVEFIGRWSMLDVFVVSLLLALVRFGFVADVEAGPGIVAFCSVVVLTMLASMSFDPRLIWDAPPRFRRASGAEPRPKNNTQTSS
jgi:paraquat-inducible protein A